MKKKHLTIVTLMAAICSLAGCSSTSAKAGPATTASDTTTTDSIVYNKTQDSTLQCNIKVDYPMGNDTLSLQIRRYLAHELEILNLPTMNGDESYKAESYQGDINNGQAIVDFYGNANFSYLANMKEDLSNGVQDYQPSLSYDISIRKTEETDTYITYQNSTYCYLAGAHGSASLQGVNIDKATGKPISETVNTLKAKEMQPLIRKGVLSYLNAEEGSAEITEEQLADYLFIENGIIPIPAFAPYLTKEGVCFVYQQYEIGPYAMGMVTFVVPYADIEPYLAPEALKLIKQTK